MSREGPAIRRSLERLLVGPDLALRRLAFMEARARRSGPTVWLTGCVHGDEVGGIVVIHELFRRLRSAPLLRGRVCAFPVLNPLGLENASRMVTPSSEDLNRAFPGDPKGTLAERIAHLVHARILATRPSVAIDLHNDWIQSVPYALLDPRPASGNREAYQRSRELALCSGLLVIDEHEEGVTREQLRHTLSGSLLAHGVPALTFELGESHVVNEENVTEGVRAVWAVLARLDLVAPLAPREPDRSQPGLGRRVLRYSHLPYASESGIVRFLVKPGDRVEAGQPLARIVNVFGKLQETLRAPEPGVVLGHTDSSVALPGTPVVAMGLPGAPPSARPVQSTGPGA